MCVHVCTRVSVCVCVCLCEATKVLHTHTHTIVNMHVVAASYIPSISHSTVRHIPYMQPATMLMLHRTSIEVLYLNIVNNTTEL